MEKTLSNAKKLAEINYETWGQWVVETYNDDELQSELDELDTLDDWVEHRKSVHSVYKEIEDTAF